MKIVSRRLAASCAIAAALASAPLRADTLFQSLPDLTVPVDGVLGSDCPFAGDAGRGYRLVDQFTLKTASVITGFTVELGQTVNAAGAKTGWPADVAFSVLEVDPASGGVSPGKVLFSRNIAAAKLTAKPISTSAILNRFLVSATLDGPKLAAGTYYVSFFNATCLLPTLVANPLHRTLLQLQPGGRKAFYADRSLGFILTGSEAK